MRQNNGFAGSGNAFLSLFSNKGQLFPYGKHQSFIYTSVGCGLLIGEKIKDGGKDRKGVFL